MEIEVLKEELKGIKEPRRTRYGNIRHKLEDIIIIGLCTIICQGEDYVDMEAFGKERETWLKTILVVSQTADKPLLEIALRQNNQAEPSKSLVLHVFKGISASSGQLFSTNKKHCFFAKNS